MRAHLAGIAATLNAAGLDVYDTTADRPDYDPSDWTAAWTATQRAAWALTYPYAVLSAPTFPEDSEALSRASLDVDATFRVTAAGSTVEQARWAHEKARTALDRARPTVADFVTLVTFSAPGIFAVDRDVSLDSGHPAYAVDTYRYRATPA